MMKRAIAAALAVGMTASLLVGCSGSGETASSSGSSGEEVVFPLEEPLELTFHYHARNMYVFQEEWPVYQEMAELTNISLINTANEVSTDSDAEIQLQAIDGFKSDIYGGNNTDTYFMTYGPEGAFYSVSDYMEYLPNFAAFLEEYPEVEAAITATDGEIYHIPYIQTGDVARTYFIRTDWLDNLGLEVPTTVEEYEEVLIAFRDDDPNGNGLNDEIPYFNDKWEEMIRLVNLWDARCYSQDTYAERVIPTEDGTVYHAWTADEFKEAIKNVSDWYTEGLIDEAIFTKGNSSRPEYLAGDIGGSTHEWVASTSAYNTQVDIEGFAFETMAPPITAEGNQWEEHQRLFVKPDGWAVSTSCEYPEEAFSYMDYFWSEEGRVLSNYGVEGEQYEYVDGEPIFTDEVLNGDVAVNEYLEESVGAQLKLGYWMDYDYEYQWTSEVGQAGVEMYTEGDYSADCAVYPTIAYTEEEQEVYDEVVTVLNDYQDEMIQRWIMADDSSIVDDEWDEYIAECEALGLNELVDMYQSAYDRYLEYME